MSPGGIIEPSATLSVHARDLRRLPERELLQTTLDFSREIERLETLRVATFAEIDQPPVSFDTLGFRSVKLWLAANTLLEVPAAAGILALVRALGRQPEIAAEYERGRVSGDHAALIAKFCEKPPNGMPPEAVGPCRKVLLDCATGPAATTDAVRGAIAKLELIFESDDLPTSTSATA